MIEREPQFQPEIPSAEAKAEQTRLSPSFLQEQIRLPQNEWDEKFREFIGEENRQNQEEIRKATEQIEDGTEEEIAPPKSPELLREQQFADYAQKLELSEGELRDKKVLDLGCGDGKFVEYLIEKGITNNAYGVDMQLDETTVEDKFKSHLAKGNFEQELPIKDAEYMLSVGAVSAVGDISEKRATQAIIEKWFENLQEGGEIRIYPIVEPAKNNTLESFKKNWDDWNEVLKKLEERGIEYRLEPKSVRVMGKDNEIVLDYLLVIKKNKTETQEPEESDKEKQWEKIVEGIEGTTDGLGKKIEKDIKDTVIGLNALGIGTYQSCHGHVNRGRISPWVAINAPNAPEPRFLPREEITKEVYEKYGISENLWKKQEAITEEWKQEEAKLQKLGDSEYRKAVDELRTKLFEKHGFFEADVEKFNQLSKDHDLKETPKYEAWSEENKKLHTRASQLLEEFYKDREVPENVKILLAEYFEGNHFNIYSGKEDYDKEPRKKISEKEKKELTKKLKLYRAEFKEFAEFLKSKFFES